VITAVLPVKSTPLTACRAVELEPSIGAMMTQNSETQWIRPVAACSSQTLRQDNFVGLPDCSACGVGKPLHVQYVNDN
jgi:hypothetical protein